MRKNSKIVVQGLHWTSGQGTIEYLVILSIVVVLGLVVVGLVTQTINASAPNISSTSNKISQTSGAISISEAVVDVNGNGLVKLKNNSGGGLTVTKLSMDGVEVDSTDTSMSSTSDGLFSLTNLGSACSCVGFVGKKKTCTLVVYATSEYGIDKKYSISVTVDCIPKITLNTVVPVVPLVTSPVVSLQSPLDGNLTMVNNNAFSFTLRSPDVIVTDCNLKINSNVDANHIHLGALVSVDTNYSINYSLPIEGDYNWNVTCYGVNGSSGTDALDRNINYNDGINPFTITIHGAASSLTDYQIQAIIPYKTGMKSDYGDVKFKDQSNVDLNYWVEDYNSTRALFWIKVPSIAANVDTNINGTYGDLSKTLDSNGYKVFVDFDDFSDNSLTGWSTQTGGGSISESGGKLRISCTNGGNNCDWYGGLNASPKVWRSAPVGEYVFQAKWTYGPVPPVDMSNRLGMFISGNPTGSASDSKFTGICDIYTPYLTNQICFAWGNIGAETGVTLNYTSQTVQSRIRKSGSNYYSDYLLGDTNWQGNTNMGTSTATYFGLIVKNFGCCGHEGLAYDDYIFSLVRKYISPEPTVDVYIS